MKEIIIARSSARWEMCKNRIVKGDSCRYWITFSDGNHIKARKSVRSALVGASMVVWSERFNIEIRTRRFRGCRYKRESIRETHWISSSSSASEKIQFYSLLARGVINASALQYECYLCCNMNVIRATHTHWSHDWQKYIMILGIIRLITLLVCLERFEYYIFSLKCIKTTVKQEYRYYSNNNYSTIL